jgi:hypothetical protein
MSKPKITPFEELLRQVDAEYPAAFGGKGSATPERNLKKIEWEHNWSNGKRSAVQIIIDPAGKDYDHGSVVSIRGLRDGGNTYPLPSEDYKDALQGLLDEPDWQDFWEDV